MFRFRGIREIRTHDRKSRDEARDDDQTKQQPDSSGTAGSETADRQQPDSRQGRGEGRRGAGQGERVFLLFVVGGGGVGGTWVPPPHLYQQQQHPPPPHPTPLHPTPHHTKPTRHTDTQTHTHIQKHTALFRVLSSAGVESVLFNNISRFRPMLSPSDAHSINNESGTRSSC